MFSLRGDAHKFYLRLKKARNHEQSIEQCKELEEIEEIQTFYTEIDSHILNKIQYRMVKEKNGSGIIPVFISAGPWLLFLFSKQLQQFLFKEGSVLWVFFVLIYITALTMSVVVHFQEKAWAAVHIEIIQDILKDRGMDKSIDHSLS
ncbi:MAG TPA: hypothetical protein VNM45_18950 [Bacillus sp. (in: firmicutes)]|nr:hypothetical protein [Bacillus sp. (in: firmicutes)]